MRILEKRKIRKKLISKIEEHNNIILGIQYGLQGAYVALVTLFVRHLGVENYYSQSIKFINDAYGIDKNKCNELEDLIRKLKISIEDKDSIETLLEKIEDSNNRFKQAKDLRNFVSLICITSSNKIGFLDVYDSMYIEMEG